MKEKVSSCSSHHHSVNWKEAAAAKKRKRKVFGSGNENAWRSKKKTSQLVKSVDAKKVVKKGGEDEVNWSL